MEEALLYAVSLGLPNRLSIFANEVLLFKLVDSQLMVTIMAGDTTHPSATEMENSLERFLAPSRIPRPHHSANG